MAKFYWDVQQGTPEWFELRSFIPTASEFDSVITPGKGELAAARKKYACRIIAARIMNWQAESLEQIRHIMDGKQNEPLAVAQLELIENIETFPIGFVTTDDGRFGASPDRVTEIGPDRSSIGITIEVKSPTIPKQFEYMLLGHGDAYRCQVQGQLYVAEADKAIFYSYSPRMPPYRIETGRDEPFIRKLKACLEQFGDELDEMTERARSLGVFQAFREVRTPVDAELGEEAKRNRPAVQMMVSNALEGDRWEP